MTKSIKADFSANRVWLSLLEDIIGKGHHSGPRGKSTAEILGNTTMIDMKYPMVTVGERKVSYPFMFAEAWHILSGRDDVKSLEPYAPSIGMFSDNGTTFAGAYGPRVVSQLKYAIDTLLADSASRQAVITIYSPNPKPSKDIPCTLSLQFLIRNNQLHCVASMRSSDAWIGYIYDIFNFSAISAYVMLEYNNKTVDKLSLGNLRLTAGSQHLYVDKIKKARNILCADRAVTMPANITRLAYITPPKCFMQIVNECKNGAQLIKAFEECKDSLLWQNV